MNNQLTLLDDLAPAAPLSFEDALELFVSGAQAKINAHYAEHYENLEPSKLSTMKGKRYVRIVSSSPGSRSAYCFVDQTNGDVLKCAGWKGPAKHARSNIYNDVHGVDGVGPYGALYLK